MKTILTLTSTQNPQIKAWRELGKSRGARFAQQAFIAEGEHMAQEALKEHCAAALLVDLDAQEKFASLIEAAACPVYLLSAHAMAAVCDAKTPQGVAAVCDMKALPRLKKQELQVALNAVQDPGNVGSILRTLDAAGFDCLIIDSETADPYAPKALRASMGAVFRIPILLAANLPEHLKALSNHNTEILAGDLHGQPFFERPASPRAACLIIGNEGAGIAPEVMAAATLRVKLPMVGGAESLNASVAAGIMIYDLLREKRFH